LKDHLNFSPQHGAAAATFSPSNNEDFLGRKSSGNMVSAADSSLNSGNDNGWPHASPSNDFTNFTPDGSRSGIHISGGSAGGGDAMTLDTAGYPDAAGIQYFGGMNDFLMQDGGGQDDGELMMMMMFDTTNYADGFGGGGFDFAGDGMGNGAAGGGGFGAQVANGGGGGGGGGSGGGNMMAQGDMGAWGGYNKFDDVFSGSIF
jgi:hypothetical protein